MPRGGQGFAGRPVLLSFWLMDRCWAGPHVLASERDALRCVGAPGICGQQGSELAVLGGRRGRGLCSGSGVPGSLVGAKFATCRIRAQERPMTVGNAPSDSSTATSAAATASPVAVPAPASWPWRRGALILAGAAQLITISALNSADPLAPSSWALL